MPLPPTYKFCPIHALIELYTKFGSDPKDKKINISRNLIYLRRRNHLTIEQVAGEIGVSRQAVSKWESGVSPS